MYIEMAAGQTIADYQKTLRETLAQNNVLRGQVRTLEARNRRNYELYKRRSSMSSRVALILTSVIVGAVIGYLGAKFS